MPRQNQHYVPRYYFRNFSKNKDSICMLLIDSGKIVEDASISNQASKNHFYGDEAVEKQVTEYDTKHSALIAKAISEINDNTISEECYFGIFEALCFQRLRTLREREVKAPLMEFYQDFFQPQIEALDDYESGVSHEATEAVKAALKTALENMSDPKCHQFATMLNVENELRDLCDLEPIFLINKTGTPFIFSDSPSVRFNIALQELQCDGLVNDSYGLMVYFPLNSEVSFMLYDASAYMLSEDSVFFNISCSEDIDALNKTQLHGAINSVYFGDFKFENYIESLWECEKNNIEEKSSKIEHLPEITLDGYITGRKIATLVENASSHQTRLTFLSTNDFSDYPYLPFRKRFVEMVPLPEGEYEKIDIQIDKVKDDI